MTKLLKQLVRAIGMLFLLLTLSFAIKGPENEVVDTLTKMSKNQIEMQNATLSNIYTELRDSIATYEPLRDRIITAWYQKQLSDSLSEDLEIFYIDTNSFESVDDSLSLTNVELAIKLNKNKLLIYAMANQLEQLELGLKVLNLQDLERKHIEYNRAVTKGHGW